MLLQRLLTGIALAALTFGIALAAPAWAWAAYAGAGTLVGAHEWARLTRCGERQVLAYVLLIGALLALVYAAKRVPASNWISGLDQSLLLIALMFWLAVVPLWLYLEWRPKNQAILLLAGVIVLLPTWIATLVLQRSGKAFLFAIGVVIVADTAAYFCGRVLGRRKLAPRISPGKTWEGVIGAFAAVLLLVLIVQWSLDSQADAHSWLATILLGGVLTTLSIEGDLFESWIKRQAGAKDSGSILPGHGGVLDRLDGLTASLPFAALYLSHATGSA